MKIEQTCICGASVKVEDDDTVLVTAAVSQWRKEHQCDGTDPWRRSEHGTSNVQLSFGFLPDLTAKAKNPGANPPNERVR